MKKALVYLESVPSAASSWVRERFLEAGEPRILGVDYGAGEYCSEIEGTVDKDGNLIILERRTWKHELELEAEPEVKS